MEYLDRYLTSSRRVPCCRDLLSITLAIHQKPSNCFVLHSTHQLLITMSSQADQPPSTVTAETSTTPKSPIVIGIYGLPGSGKSTLLENIKKWIPDFSDKFAIYEGSAVIASLMGPNRGLADFHALTEEEKPRYRELAINHIRDECQKTGLAGLVAGHYMFWPKDSEQGTVVWTKADQDTFTHIIYLEVTAELLYKRRRQDQTRPDREKAAPGHLHKWQAEELRQLEAISKSSGIRLVRPNPARLDQGFMVPELTEMLHEFCLESEPSNHTRVSAAVDEMVAIVRASRDTKLTKVTTALVFDADKTLTAMDTGEEFWKLASNQRIGVRIGRQPPTPAGDLFCAHGYTYEAFHKVAVSYNLAPKTDFEGLCEEVAENTILYPEFLSLLRRVESRRDIMVLAVTCGLRQVWQTVVEQNGLGEHVKVLGNGGIWERLIITDKTKEAVVSRLRGPPHNLRVVAFGDSSLDLPMLLAADEGIVVVGEEQARSRSMEDALSTAIGQLSINGPPQTHNLRQMLIPTTVTPRLDTSRLPLVDFYNTIDPLNVALFGSSQSKPTPNLLHATDRSSAKLMTTPTRDATISGPALREAHRRIGWYLATEFITSLIGLEEYSIPHVQGHTTTGHRLRHEQNTTIVALMRGGEPMAFGVNDAFPLAMFLHAKTPEDVKPHHLDKQHTIILVDSVVNNGKTVLEFLARIRGMKEGKDIRVVVVAGVVQADAMGPEHELGQVLRKDGNFHLVALRVSENKFTGRGGTDTGNRLFGTTRLD